MTIEEKAKAYDKAIERANELNYVSDKDSLQHKTVEHIFPELKESEDERVRKEIIDFIYDKTDTYELREKSNSWLAWLEKQGEQKSAWSEEDERKINYLIALLQNSTMNDDALRVMNEEVENWLKSLRPQNRWKPNDEQMDALHYVTNFDYGGHKSTLVSLYEQLKKLK